MQWLAAGLSVQDAVAIRSAGYAELISVQCVSVRGGVVAMAAVRAEALAPALAVFRAPAFSELIIGMRFGARRRSGESGSVGWDIGAVARSRRW